MSSFATSFLQGSEIASEVHKYMEAIYALSCQAGSIVVHVKNDDIASSRESRNSTVIFDH